MNGSQVSIADYQRAMNVAQEATYLWIPELDTLEWSENSSRILEDSVAVKSGSVWRAALLGDAVDDRDSWLSSVDQSGGFFGTYRLDNGSGGLWIEERLARLSDGEEGIVRYLGRVRDVSEEQNRIAHLDYLARFDELTGQLSRPYFRTVLDQKVTEAQNEEVAISFGLVGLDNLSGFNVMFGYDVADAVLVRVGEEIKRRLGPKDSIGRIGSSKFGILFHDCPRDCLKARLAEFQKCIRDTVIETEAGPVVVTVSAAGLSLPEDAATTYEALAVAEDTLNQAKQFGLDQVVIYTPNAIGAAERRDNIALADDLLAALRENRLCLAYQPVVQARDVTQVAFHECLLRLINRNGEVTSAGAFIPVAEKLGMIRMLDRRVLELAFETLRRNSRVRLSINISPQSLRDCRWNDTFERLAAENPNALERIILEVTEATVIDDVEVTAQTLTRFREMGCTIALDDFGAGYTSFQQLRDLKFDIVKIDGSYIRDILENPSDQVFVEALTSIAEHHDVLVVAEMVDSHEAADLLRTLRVDTFQSFLFGRPEIQPDWLHQDRAEKIIQTVAKG